MKNKVTINDYEIAGRMPTFKRELRDLVRRGVKTQTRRVMKPQPPHFSWSSVKTDDAFINISFNEKRDYWVKCPYGRVGDIRVMLEPLYRNEAEHMFYYDDRTYINSQYRWSSPILSSLFMPTALGRTLVRYTSISVERLQDITDAGAIAEGIQLRGITRYEGEARNAYIAIVTKQFGWKPDDWLWVIKWELIK